MNYQELSVKTKGIVDNISKAFMGREEIATLAVVALIADGHILMEDVPGTGKTLLAKALARSIDCKFSRIQFTPDLLPSDISGINYFNQKQGEFVFRAGPVFSNILLADEINRATPRTQSAMLECMSEKQVTIDGVTTKLSSPFLVIATQNPIETQGTFPLPEAQLDRFFIKMKIGYPDTEASTQILRKYADSIPLEKVQKVVTGDEVVEMQNLVREVHINNDLLRYIVTICEATRSHIDVLLGASTRAAQSLVAGVRAYAAIQGRGYVIPDDVKYMVRHILPHRLMLKTLSKARSNENINIINEIIDTTPVPTEDFTQE